MLKGFKNFLMRGDVVVVAVGLVIALAFSGLVNAFTSSIVNPLITRAQGGHALGLGVQLGQKGNTKTFLDIGSFISAIIYFLIFMAVVYVAVVTPYKMVMARKGSIVFGEPSPMQTCPACLSSDLPVGATRCKYCTTDLIAPQDAATGATPSPRPHS